MKCTGALNSHDVGDHSDGPNICRRTDHLTFNHLGSLDKICQEDKLANETLIMDERKINRFLFSPMYSSVPAAVSCCLRLRGLKL